MGNFVQPLIAGGLAYATGGLSTAVGIAFTASAAVGAVGAITGDKDLMKVGTLIGLGAGVASLAGVGTGALAGEAGAGAAADSIVEAGALESAGGSAAADTALEMSQAANYGTVAAPGTAAINAPATPVAGVAEKAAVVAGSGGATAAPASSGIINAIKNADPLTKYGMLQVGGNALAGAFGPDQEKIAADKLALEQQRLEQEQANIDYKRANMNNIGLINMRLSPNYSASLYPNKTGAYPYRTPVITKP